MNHPSLSEFQLDFKNNLLSEKIDHAFLRDIKQHSPGEAAARITIYRNNVMHSLTEAVGDLYPVVKRLMGDDCFRGVAAEFVRAYPPSQASLSFYGGEFVDFITQHAACAHLHYLRDVARIEWCYHCAFHAPDVPVLSITDLQQVDEQQLGEAVLIAHSSLYLCDSAWPVDVIWEANIQESTEVIHLDEYTPCQLAIYRNGLHVNVISLTLSCFTFLQNLVQGYTIENAWVATEAPLDELGPQLGYLLGLNLFSGIKVCDERGKEEE